MTGDGDQQVEIGVSEAKESRDDSHQDEVSQQPGTPVRAFAEGGSEFLLPLDGD